MPDSKGEAADAARRLEQVRGRVRSAARWHGWMWLAVGVATPVFFLGTQAGRPRLSLWVALAFMALGLGLWIVEARRPVRGRTTARIDRPATTAYIAAVVVVVVASLIGQPTGLPLWFAALALLPAVPAAATAVTILRS